MESISGYDVRQEEHGAWQKSSELGVILLVCACTLIIIDISIPCSCAYCLSLTSTFFICKHRVRVYLHTFLGMIHNCLLSL